LNIFEDYNEPIDQPLYQNEHDELIKTLVELHEALESVDEAKRGDIKAKITEMEINFLLLENEQYLISPDQIASYRVIAKNTVLFTDIFSHEIFKDIRNLYLNGQYSADQYIHEMDRTVRMMQMEGY